MDVIDFINSFSQSNRAKKGFSLTLIGAAILLMLSNLGIEIKFAHTSIHDVLPQNSLVGVQLYIIGSLFAVAYTILKGQYTNPKIVSDKSATVTCHNCSHAMEVTERKCVECGSIFTYKNENESKSF